MYPHVMTDGRYDTYNLQAIHDSIRKDRDAYAAAINAEIAEKGQANALPHLARLWVEMQYQEQQTQLAIASELRQLNKILQEQYWHATRHRMRWEAFRTELRQLLAWRPRFPGFQAAPSGT